MAEPGTRTGDYDDLVALLDADDLATREWATVELYLLGARALMALRRALHPAAPAERFVRSRELIRRIEGRR